MRNEIYESPKWLFTHKFRHQNALKYHLDGVSFELTVWISDGKRFLNAMLFLIMWFGHSLEQTVSFFCCKFCVSFVLCLAPEWYYTKIIARNRWKVLLHDTIIFDKNIFSSISLSFKVISKFHFRYRTFIQLVSCISATVISFALHFATKFPSDIQ